MDAAGLAAETDHVLVDVHLLAEDAAGVDVESHPAGGLALHQLRFDRRIGDRA